MASKRGKWLPALLAALSLAVLAAVILVWWSGARRQSLLDAQTARLRSLGGSIDPVDFFPGGRLARPAPPATLDPSDLQLASPGGLEELKKASPAQLASAPGAPASRKAAFDAATRWCYDGSWMSPRLSWDDKWTPFIQWHFSANADALSRIREAAKKADACFPVDWSKRPVTALDRPHLLHIHVAAAAFALSAVVKARDGNLDAASDDVLTALRMRRLIAHEPFLYAYLVSARCDAVALKALETTLSADAPSRESLLALLAELDGREDMNRLTWYLLSHVPFGLSAVDEVAQRPNNLRAYNGGAAVKMPNIPGPSWVRAAAFRLSWSRTADAANFIRVMCAQVEASMKPFPAALDMPSVGSVLAGAPPGETLVANALGSWTTGITSHEAHADVRVRCARIALAAELFRLDSGVYPETLDALTPAYLPAVQLDPFDGAPLKYRLAGDRFLLYSVGRNRSDDGGDGDDIVWQRSAQEKTAP